MFTSRIFLNQHIREEHGSESLDCRKCGKIFDSVDKFIIHNSHHDTKNFSPILCEQCGKEFQYQSHLKRHMQVAHLKENLDCPLCNKKYSCQATLKNHLLEHENSYMYVCEICNHGFNLKGNYEKHLGTHPETRLQVPTKFNCPD